MNVAYNMTLRPNKFYSNSAPLPASAIVSFNVEKKTSFVDADFVPVSTVPAAGYNDVALALNLPSGLSTLIRVTQKVNDGSNDIDSPAASRSVAVAGDPPVQPGLPSGAPTIVEVVPQ